MPDIDYYFTCISPWTLLGHDAFVALARRHGARVRYRPVDLSRIFPETGGLPLAKRAPARQAYRIVDLKRWRDVRGVPLRLAPAHFPTDPKPADRTVLALQAAGHDPDRFVHGAISALWCEDRDIADRAVLLDILARVGIADGDGVLAASDGADIAGVYDDLTASAPAVPVFGAPTYVVAGEPFWGQDRLDLLERALALGRPPYTSDIDD